MKAFIYSEQQKVLAGRDGEQLFNAVFGEKARVVVILFRKEWGQTPFTRIEETAIKNRAFDYGYDFTGAHPPPTVVVRQSGFQRHGCGSIRSLGD